jgi:hypothetical protein
MSLRTTSRNRASNFTFTNSQSGGGSVGTSSVSITSIVVTDSNFNNLDDTAIATSNSYIKIIGSGFNSSANIWVAGTKLSSGVTYVNSTEIRVTMPAVSLGNTNIFVFNPDNSGAIWAPGLLVSGTPEFSQTAYSTSTPLEVSIQLLATGDATLTYALQAGSSLPGTLTLSSGGLITGATVDGVYQFTVIVTDAQLQSYQQQITLTITSTDANFKSTVLAINADANTFVRDASSNSFAVTINGDTKPSAFSPYNTNWSNLFDGSGDYLSIPTSNTLMHQIGNWTYEGWIYWNSMPTTGYQNVFGQGAGGQSSFGLTAYNGSSWSAPYKFVVNQANIGNRITGTTTLVAGTWYHFAVVRNSGVITLYVNGTSEGTFSDSTDYAFGGNAFTIGNSSNGYISNFRFNRSAVYTSNFTPPTSALTAVANTSLLTCQSNRFIDNSNNAFTITKNGDTKVVAFGPFTETDTTTGSGYFDGTGDYLTVPNNNNFNLPGDFTLEFWINNNSISSSPNYICIGSSSATNNGLLIYYSNGATSLRIYSNGAALIAGPSLINNVWYHIALVRSGSGSNNLKLYVDGVSAGQATSTTTFTGVAGNGVAIGSEYTSSHSIINNYYMSDVRIVKGTAVYTSAFTPPTSALTAIANTSLLTLQTRIAVNNHTFVDHSGINNLITRAGNASQGSFSPFSPAGWSNYFDGTGDYIQVGNTNSAISWLNTAGSVGTIEAWVYPTSFRSGNQVYTHPCILGLGGTYFNFGLANGTPRVYWWTGATTTLDANSTISLNTWSHLAIVFNGSGANNLKIYVNGTLAATGTFTNINWASASGGNNVYVGIEEANSPTSAFLGYISNLRIINGTALYTSNFTPPTSALTAVANTSLLTCHSNRFIDNSNNAFTLTRTGDTKVVNLSPFAPTVPYSRVTHGGSVYFDGSGDYLEMPAGSNWNFGTGAFTFETWIFPTGSSSSYELFGISRSTSNEWSWAVTTGNSWGIYWYWGNSGSNQTERYTGRYPVAGQWNHLVVSRDTDFTWRFYLNGALIATSIFQQNTSWSDSRSFDNTGVSPRIGGSFAGWMTDMRVTKGVALYNTSTINLPAAPLTPIPRTIFLSNFNNPSIIDVTSRNVFETVGDAKIRTDVKKYGTGSVYFDGTTDYVVQPSSVNYEYGTGDFTIEFWLYLNSTGLQTIVSNLSAATGGVQPHIYINTTIRYYTNSADRITGASLSSGQWYHIAVSRGSGSTRLFVNGTQSGSTYADTNNYTTAPLGVGTYWEAGAPVTTNTLNGYIDDLRITKGVARYTANFTAPTSTILTQ